MNAPKLDLAKDLAQREALKRAEQVTLADFSASLSSGILTAIDARRLRPKDGGIDWRPWIWAGWIIGDSPLGPNGPFGGGDGPFGGGMPGGPG